jgi:hypothetical protein
MTNLGKTSYKKRKENESIGLTRQNHNPGHEMMITQSKANPLLKDQ